MKFHPESVKTVLISLITCLIFHCSQPAETVSESKEIKSKADYLDRLEKLGFSGAVLIARKDQVLLEKGFGLADREEGIPVAPDTIFTVGSITKQFTAAAILKLEMKGLLKTSDRITEYFADVPEDKQEITLHHLLTHSAGFPGAIGDDFDTALDARAFAKLAMDAELVFAPGTGYEYSNVGYSLLGIIIEKASGSIYEEFLRKELFEPSGMLHTGYVLPAYREEELAVGYQGNERWGSVLRRPMRDDGPSWHLRGNGGIHSNLKDMFRWFQALTGDSLFPSEMREKLFSPFVDEGGGDSFYGYGWVIIPDYLGRKLITHNGGNGIFTADFRWFPEDSLLIYATSNLSEWAPVDLITRDLSHLFFGSEIKWPPDVLELTEDRLMNYEGRYQLPSGEEIRVSREENHLVIRGNNPKAASLLSGGSGDLESPKVTSVQKKSIEILTRAYNGDFTGIQEAFGGRFPLDQIQQEEERWMAMRKQRLGEFQSLEAVMAFARGSETIVFLQTNYENGSGFIQYIWENGELSGITLERELPKPEKRVYPISETAFESFSLRSQSSVKIIFEFSQPDEPSNNLLFVTENGNVQAERN